MKKYLKLLTIVPLFFIIMSCEDYKNIYDLLMDSNVNEENVRNEVSVLVSEFVCTSENVDSLYHVFDTLPYFRRINNQLQSCNYKAHFLAEIFIEEVQKKCSQELLSYCCKIQLVGECFGIKTEKKHYAWTETRYSNGLIEYDTWLSLDKMKELSFCIKEIEKAQKTVTTRE